MMAFVLAMPSPWWWLSAQVCVCSETVAVGFWGGFHRAIATVLLAKILRLAPPQEAPMFLYLHSNPVFQSARKSKCPDYNIGYTIEPLRCIVPVEESGNPSSVLYCLHGSCWLKEMYTACRWMVRWGRSIEFERWCQRWHRCKPKNNASNRCLWGRRLPSSSGRWGNRMLIVGCSMSRLETIIWSIPSQRACRSCGICSRCWATFWIYPQRERCSYKDHCNVCRYRFCLFGSCKNGIGSWGKNRETHFPIAIGNSGFGCTVWVWPKTNCIWGVYTGLWGWDKWLNRRAHIRFWWGWCHNRCPYRWSIYWIFYWMCDRRDRHIGLRIPFRCEKQVSLTPNISKE